MDPSGLAPLLFPTCLVESLRPELVERCVDVLQARGPVPSVVPGVTCCGQPAWNAGFAEAARRVARATLRRLRTRRGVVVVPSGSCATMMRHHWPELFAGTRDEAAAREVAGRVVELSSHLDALPAPRAAGRGEHGRPVATPVTVHDSCHGLRELGVKEQPRRLLREAGVVVEESPGAERCCGFGGTFAVKLPAISVAMADERLDEWVGAGVRTVVGCDLSCLVHLEARARRRSLPIELRHVVEVVGGP
jgi:L-lactate dehydrogenase complex protein LldE